MMMDDDSDDEEKKKHHHSMVRMRILTMMMRMMRMNWIILMMRNMIVRMRMILIMITIMMCSHRIIHAIADPTGWWKSPIPGFWSVSDVQWTCRTCTAQNHDNKHQQVSGYGGSIHQNQMLWFGMFPTMCLICVVQNFGFSHPLGSQVPHNFVHVSLYCTSMLKHQSKSTSTWLL